jgi:hypothetical protein
MLHTCDLPHQRDDDPMMHVSSELVADASKNGTMLGHDVVERDRAHLEDIGRKAAVKIGEVAWQGHLIHGRRRAAWLLDGIVPFRCKLTHARAHPQHHERELRQLCIQFLSYGTKMLTRGGRNSMCREFGPLAPQMLKEFCGHKSYT